MISIFVVINFDCKKEESSFNEDGEHDGKPCPETPVVDWKGQVYNTVQIGSQCWMKENLNVGIMINSDQEMTDNNIIEKYCYNNDTINCDIYGGLYQWAEIMKYTSEPGSQGICPPGWHVSSFYDWSTLELYLGGSGIDFGGKLKEVGFDLWKEPNEGATNSSEFSAKPAGIRNGSGSFEFLSEANEIWNSDEWDENRAQNTGLYYTDAAAGFGIRNKNYGLSVRCIKN